MKPKGLRMRRTVRGRVISPDITQINFKVVKDGKKKLSEVFADQKASKEKKENRAMKRATKKGMPKEESKTKEKPAEKANSEN